LQPRKVLGSLAPHEKESRWTRFTRGLTVFLVGVPLAWAVLILFHPLTRGAAYEGLRDAVTRWQVVHVGTLIFIGLMGLAVCLLVRDLAGPAARVTRIAAGLFVLLYAAWESVAGLAVGALVQHTNGLPADERAVASDAIESLIDNAIVGNGGLSPSSTRPPEQSPPCRSSRT
jgi:hypothetical protein